MRGFRQYAALSKRAIISTVRQPAAIIPTMIFPLIFLAMGSAALGRTTLIPGFPEVRSFMQFAFTATIIQGILFGSTIAGGHMAIDIEDGFFDRLISSPVARTSILVSRVTGAAILGFLQTFFYVGAASPFGLRFESGWPGIFMLATITALLAAGMGSIMVAFALRTGSSEAVQGSFPLIFIMLFISSAFFPRDLMEGWFKTAASLNPMSWLIEGMRHQVIGGLDGREFLRALGTSAGIFALGIGLAAGALRGRLTLHHG